MQTAVSLNQDVAIRGMVAKYRPVDIFTGVNQEDDDDLNFGDPVYISDFNDDNFHVRKMGTTGSTAPRIDGFVVYDSRMSGQIQEKQSVGIVRKGFIWVAAGVFSGAVSAGAEIYYDLSAGKFVTGGTKASGDITNHGLVLWSAVTAAEATAGSKLLLLEVNLPGYSVTT